MKLKKLLKETNLWNNRKFGDRLPTVADYKEAYNKKNGINEEDLNEAKVTVGFSNEMGALYVSKGSGKSVELRKADVEQIIKQYKKFKSKMD